MRIAIITDIHEDVISLKNALRKIEKQKCDEIVCLGDISGFSAMYYNYLQSRNAHECLQLLRENCKHILLGNHDIHAGQIIPQSCSFFEFPNNWYELDYHDRQLLGGQLLWLHEEDDLDPLYKQSDIQYLKTLKEFVVKEQGDIRILFSHYIYPNTSGLKKEFYTYRNEFQQHFNFMETQGCTISFTGHAHTNGCFFATKHKFREKGYKKFQILPDEPTCVGIPPITGQRKRSGFCIFDTEELIVNIIKI